MSKKHHFYALMIFAVVVSLVGQMLLPMNIAASAASPASQARQLSSEYNARVTSDDLLSTTDAFRNTATAPQALTAPLSISRVQSNYQSGDTVVITYTLQNTLDPQYLPDLPPDAAPGEIVDAMAAFDLSADPNTLDNVILIATPTGDSAILSTSQPADVDDDQYVFLFDNLPPRASAAVVVTATTPASVSAATPLVNAAGWASLKGQEVKADAATAVVIPSDLGPWLISTIDANTSDEEMLQALAQTGGDPAAIFDFVRGFGFEAYRGSLRGTRGTLWSRAGNSLDQASLLIAMLRASGIPARYRHGTLSEADAQTLIASMFPAPTAILGQVAPEVPISDPVNDPALIAEVQDHWWVEAHISGGWTDLDPSFAGAAIGQSFASQIAADGTDRIAELTDDVRPKVRIRLDVELYNQLNAGGQPQVETQLDHTFRVVEIATASVVFAHYVTTEAQGGMVYGTTSHTYTPFLHVNDNDDMVFGEPYQELVTNFPLATTFVTGAWLRFEIEDIDGEVTSYERTLRDRLGYEIRTYGGTPDIALDDSSPPIFSEFDIYSLSFFPNVVPTDVFEARQGALTGVLAELADDTDRMQALAALQPLDATQQSEANQIRARYQLNLSLFLNNVSMSFAEAADRASRISQEGLYVKAYHDDPRLVILSHEVVSDTSEINVDLRTTLERAIAHPGQGEPATFSFNLFKGINESWLEGKVLAPMTDATVLTAEAVMRAAWEQGIEFAFISETNLDLLSTMDLSAEAEARITTAVLDGKLINIPTTAPLIDGEPAIGWWEIDAETGETIGVMENGLHNALIEFFVSLLFGTTVGRLTDFMIGATAATWDFVGQQFFKATGSGDFGTPANDALSKTNQGLACLLGDTAGCIGGKGYLDYGYMAMEAYLNYRNTNDPPLPDLLLGNTTFTPTQTIATVALNVPADTTAGTITADLQTDFTQLSDAGGGLSFYAAALDPLASGSSDGAAAVNHVNSTSLTLTGADVQIAAPGGSLTVGGQPVALGDGLAIAGFDGTLDLTAATAESDALLLSGTGDVFALTTVPGSTTITPINSATFDVELTTTAADAFTVTVSAPEAWEVAIDDAGQVTATPPSGTVPDDYTLVVTAQSAASPNLLLTAEHTVTITSHDGIQLNLVPDPLITVPMGPEVENRGFINTGQAQVPGAAYVIELTNPANVPHTYDLSVSGLPAGWTLLGGEPDSTSATLALPPGALGQIGLYVTPDSLPPVGTTYDITVVATDENGLSASATETFVMPAVPFSYVTVDPATQAVTSTSTTAYDVTVTNVGNAAGDFGLTAEAYSFDGSVNFGPLPTPVNIPASGSETFPVTVATTDAPTRTNVLLFFGSPVANTIYTPTAIVELWVASPEAEPIINAASICELPPTVDGAFLALASAVDELSYWCEAGDCPLPLRDEVVAAGESLVTYARIDAQPTTLPALADVEAALTQLSTQTSDSDILDAVADLGAAVYALGGKSCEVNQHRADARFTPYVDAILLGDTADFSLDVTNEGTLATTYAITVTGLPGGDLLFNESIDPGATIMLPVTASPSELGTFDLTAEIVPVAPDVNLPIVGRALARLNVVDKFVQVTQVTADPAFVETGTSSTTLSIEVTNVANIARAATAHTEIIAPGGAVSYTNDTPLTILIGDPRTYTLDTLDTSGWTKGVYTITVELRDEDEVLIPDGSNYGYLSVGQAVGVSHAVQPVVVAPGNVTVTTAITTEILVGLITGTQTTTPLWAPTGLRAPISDQSSIESGQPSVDNDQVQVSVDQPAIDGPYPVPNQTQIIDTGSTPLIPTPYTITGTVILRHEEDEAALTGTWTSHNDGRASNGSYLRANAAGETAVFTVTGTWAHLGFLASSSSGQAEVFIDGISQGVLDLYRREDIPVSFVYDGLVNATHTISVTALGTANPYASNDYVNIDYVDVYDGGAYADGTFEEDDTRLFLSTGWDLLNDGAASGGSYMREDNATAWFPFTGDSVTYQALAYNGGGRVDVSIDGVFQTRLNLHSLTAVTRTLSFEGLGAGPHVLQVTGYRGNTTVDAFTTPGQSPFWTPPTPSGFTRFEDDDPAMLYNGVPFTQTARSWKRNTNRTEASSGQRIYSQTAGDTISLTFDGVWASVGFFTNRNSGEAEIHIDGVSQGIVDLYSNEEGVSSFTYDGLVSGTHTISVTVLGTSNPLAQGTYVSFDYVDTWDGSPLPDGRFEEMDERVLLSGGWSHAAEASTSGGAYLETSLNGEPTFWFPFTGDSVTYQAFDYFRSHEVAIYIDEVYQGLYDIRTGEAPTITYSFDNLGAGLHMLKVRHYREEATLDAFITPAISSPTPPPTPTVFTRIEEDDPAIRYNGLPYSATATTWNRVDGVGRASDGQHIYSAVAGDTLSYTFDGTWIHASFVTSRDSGQAEVFIDGVSQGIIDLYTRDRDVVGFVYDGLLNTTHTISITVLGMAHPNSSGTRVQFDSFDTWDGTALPANTYEETDPLVWLSDLPDDWSYVAEPAASGGGYLTDDFFSNDGTIWFPFTGDSITFLGLANSDADQVAIDIDGTSYGTFNLYSGTPITRPFSFDGLGAGPHVIRIRHNRSEPNVDAFVVPGTPPFYETPVHTGVVRYEEDHPALVYNGLYDFRTRPQSWALQTDWTVSGGWNLSSGTVSDTVSLTFDGRWAGIGFIGRNGTSQAEVFIDGVSQGVLDLDNGGAGEIFHTFGDLITGTHTLSVSVVSGYVRFDYIDVWDGQPTPAGLINARRGEDNHHLSYATNINDYGHPNAIEGDYAGVPVFNFPANLWFNFVGDSFTFYYLSQRNGGSVNVYVDGQFVETVSQDYEFSEQPFGVSYDGFGDGPHVVRVESVSAIRADAFRAPADPRPYTPKVEWFDTTPNGTTGAFGSPAGAITGLAAGDIDGDGSTEIVIPSDTFSNSTFINSIFVYRGDGQDTGDGDPIIRRIDFTSSGTGIGREYIGSVALADLDDQPGAEIVVAGSNAMYAFHSDGSTYWMTDTLPAESIRGTPAIGNLDFDPQPEILVNLRDTLAVFEHDGTIAWSETFPDTVGMPLLVDMDENGTLDIVAYDIAGNVYLYNYNFGAPTLEWTTTLSTTVDFIFGGPAVADVDGQQPGGDDGPEIAITSNGLHTVLDADGSVVWSTALDPGDGGGVSVADVDGDGEIELVTGTRYDDGTGVGRLYALNADGSILWGVPAYDSTSANSQAVLDLNGDGVYEIAWNGAQYGFTIFDGTDGSILYNEPLIESRTGTEYPIFADVDDDGYAEVAVPYNDGLAVIGMDGVWGEARPLWNQHTYHITNVNDDLSVPSSEAPSSEVHNTYRTQWPETVVLPAYDVTITHTAGISGVSVLTGTFSTPPTATADPTYRWDYSQTPSQQVVTRTFASELTDLQPGESRLIAQGTELAYTFPGGSNGMALPPLYVTVPGIVEITPESATAFPGTTAIYTLTLTNPATAATYTLTTAGPVAAWTEAPSSVPVPANSTVTVPLTLTLPMGAEPDEFPVLLDVTTDSGGEDQAAATLTLLEGMELSLNPATQSTVSGQPVTYTLAITNLTGDEQTYDLTASGLPTVMLPPSVAVGGGETVTVSVTAVDSREGRFPFTILAESAPGSAEASATLVNEGRRGVTAALAQDPALGGPGATTPLTLTLSNEGSLEDTYDLTVDVPAGWTARLEVNGNTVDALTLPPHLFNTADLRLLVTPAVGSAPGDYAVTATAVSRSDAGVTASATGTVQVTDRGVEVTLSPANQTIPANQSATWDVTVTNRGSVADTFDLTATGLAGMAGIFNQDSLSLTPGESQTVQLVASGLDFVLSTRYRLNVLATSQVEPAIQGSDEGLLTVTDYAAVEMAWEPPAQTVTDTLEATYHLAITNTGNMPATYDVSVAVTGGSAQVGLSQVLIPAHSTVLLPVAVQVPGEGTYPIEGTAAAPGATASQTADLTVVSTEVENVAPLADAGLDQEVAVGSLVTLDGSASTDPDGHLPLDYGWRQVGGTTVDLTDAMTAAPTFTAPNAPGVLTFTLTVTDSLGLVDPTPDSVVITITDAASPEWEIYLPLLLRNP